MNLRQTEQDREPSVPGRIEGLDPDPAVFVPEIITSDTDLRAHLDEISSVCIQQLARFGASRRKRCVEQKRRLKTFKAKVERCWRTVEAVQAIEDQFAPLLGDCRADDRTARALFIEVMRPEGKTDDQ